MRYFFFASILIVFVAKSALTQDYTVQVKHLGVENGLLHREVSTVFEDNNHLIWIGSSKGLQRYDGHEFNSWTLANTGGKIGHITMIGQGADEWLWLWNNQRETFVFFHPLSQEILTEEERFGAAFPIKRGPEGTGWNSPWRQLQTDSRGRFIFTSSRPNELIFYDATAGFERVSIPRLQADFIELYHIDRQDYLWITEKIVGSTLHKVDTNGQILASYDFSESFDIYNFSEKNGKIYFTVDHRDTDQFYEVGADGEPQLIREQPKSMAWASYLRHWNWEVDKNGWRVFGANQEEPLFTLDRQSYNRSLFDFRNSFYQDSRDRVWVASAFGLDMILVRPNHFLNYLSFPANASKPVNNSARGIWVERDTLYANFEFGGLLAIPKDQPNKWRVIDRQPSFADYFGRPLLRTFGNEFMVGHPNELRRISFAGTQMETVTFSEQFSPYRFNHTWSFYRDSLGTIWIGTSKGLAYLKPLDSIAYAVDNELKVFNPNDEEAHIYHITPTKKGFLWLCSQAGLYLFDPQEQIYLARFGSRESDEFYLPANTFYHLHQDSEEILWLGTAEGLLRWDRATGEQALFNLYNGLSNDVIYAVYPDVRDHLWLSSNYGIIQFDKATHQVRSYQPRDGIAQEEFNRISHARDADGTIYFGGLNGITAFHPEDFYEASAEKPFKLLITGLEIYDGAAAQIIDKTRELQQTRKIIFRAQDYFFRVKFTLPTLQWDEQRLYGWKIEGVDNEWHYQSENTLQVGKLPYGEHVLRIKGRGNGGKWSPHELSILVKVLKPFYLQLWFIGLLLFGLVGGMSLWFRWRTYQYKRSKLLLQREVAKATAQIEQDKETIEAQAVELKRMDEVKSRLFANVAHELRTPLTLMLGPISSVLKNGQLATRQLELLKKAKLGGEELLRLIGTILDLSKMDSGKIELKERAELLFPLVRNIAANFETYAQQEGIRFLLQYQAEKSLCLDLDREKVEIILNNLLSNAIKFTSRGGEVSLNVLDMGNAVQFSIADTGRGIHPEDIPHIFNRYYQSTRRDTPIEGGTGIGLALSREYVKLMNGKIWANSTLGEGSTFYVRLPRKELLSVPDLGLRSETSIGGSLKSRPMQTTDEDTQLSTLAVSASGSITGRTARLLIVEDNYELRDYLKTILAPHFDVLLAENGQVALDILQKDLRNSARIQLVLSDIMMPVMDGYQLLQAIKTDEDLGDLPVIMLTAKVDNRAKLKALRIGVDDYLLKPFEEVELLARIHNLLGHQNERLAFHQEHHSEQKTSQEDREWLERFEHFVADHLSDDRLSVLFLAQEFAMSESTLLRQLKRLTGLTPSKYLKEFRLGFARELLEKRTYSTIAKVAFQVGFKDAKYFARSFKARYGKSPSAYLKK